MSNTIFLERNYLIAAIINIKKELNKEEYTNIQEYNHFEIYIYSKFNEFKLHSVIVNRITKEFEVKENKILPKENENIDIIIKKYKDNTPEELKQVLYNHEIMKEIYLKYIENEKQKIKTTN